MGLAGEVRQFTSEIVKKELFLFPSIETSIYVTLLWRLLGKHTNNTKTCYGVLVERGFENSLWSKPMVLCCFLED